MPDTFMARDYQAHGIAWILQRPFSGLIMRPGLGKTACVCAARVLLKKKKLSKRCLVIAPFNVASLVWHEEIAKWGFDLKIGFAHGPKFERVIQDESLDIVTMTFDGLARLDQTFTPRDIMKLFDHLVIDEATGVKHVNTKRFKLLKPYLSSFARRTILTGTPKPNGYEDLFGQAFVTDRGLRLGKYKTRYLLEYFDQVGYGGYSNVLKDGADKLIQKKLGDIWLFINDEALGLRRYQLNPIRVTMPPKAFHTYTELRREMIIEMDGTKLTAASAAVLSNKLRQLASGQAYGVQRQLITLHDAKLEALEGLVDQLQGDPLLLGYEFDHERQLILKRYSSALSISGATGKAERKRILTAFNTGEHPLLVAQSGTIAHGLNLQRACATVAFYTLPWNLEIFEQFIKRVHRLGQKRRVMVHALITKDTIDEGVLKVLVAKDKSQRSFIKALTLHITDKEEKEHDAVRRRRKVSRQVPPARGAQRGRTASARAA